MNLNKVDNVEDLYRQINQMRKNKMNKLKDISSKEFKYLKKEMELYNMNISKMLKYGNIEDLEFDGDLDMQKDEAGEFWYNGIKTYWDKLLSTDKTILKCYNKNIRFTSRIKEIPFDPSEYEGMGWDPEYDDDPFDPNNHEISYHRFVYSAINIGDNTKIIIEIENRIYVGMYTCGNDAHMKILTDRSPWIRQLDALIDDFILTK